MSNRYIYHNPNREGKHVGDCVIRALSTVLHLDWDETFLRLSMLAYEMADMMDSNAVWGRFLNLYGFVYPKGSYDKIFDGAVNAHYMRTDNLQPNYNFIKVAVE